LTALVTCPQCGTKRLLTDEDLARHLRILHGYDVASAQDQTMTNTLDYSELAIVPTLPKLLLRMRKSTHVAAFGRCDLCDDRAVPRWLFRDTGRGDVYVCAKCRNGLANNRKKVDAMKSRARLPGSYGG
jgi:DNA-directed RNA polymerase subunit RPC12/RpoP